MKNIARTLTTACFVAAALLAGQSGTAEAGKLRDTGVCKLKNTKADHVIYNGECRITQEQNEYCAALITVKLGQAQAFKFCCHPDGKCMTGPTEARVKDHGDGNATFLWEDFRLDVSAD
jgi:hypothetical protein